MSASRSDACSFTLNSKRLWPSGSISILVGHTRSARRPNFQRSKKKSDFPQPLTESQATRPLQAGFGEQQVEGRPRFPCPSPFVCLDLRDEGHPPVDYRFLARPPDRGDAKPLSPFVSRRDPKGNGQRACIGYWRPIRAAGRWRRCQEVRHAEFAKRGLGPCTPL